MPRSAFKWHGEAELAQCQATELDDLYALARKHMPVRMDSVRSTRTIEDYSGKELSENVASRLLLPTAGPPCWLQLRLLEVKCSAAAEAELVRLLVFIS